MIRLILISERIKYKLILMEMLLVIIGQIYNGTMQMVFIISKNMIQKKRKANIIKRL